MPSNKLIFGLLLCSISAKATLFPATQGPFALSFGGISASKKDPFSSANHPGSLAFAESSNLAFGFRSHYLVEGLNTAQFSMGLKLQPHQTMGVAYSFFGNRWYNENLIKLSFAQKFNEDFGAGVSLDYLRNQRPSGRESAVHLFTCELGCYAALPSHFDLAFHIINPFRAQLADYLNEKLPFVTRSTLFYNPTTQVNMACEWQQTMNGPGFLKIGLLLRASEKLQFQLGLNPKPFQSALGLSYRSKKIELLLGFNFHPYLKSGSAVGLSSPIKFSENGR